VNKISLVVSDVDGTLVTRDKALTPRTIAAVEQLHARGIQFSICSSRPPFGLLMLIEPLHLALPFWRHDRQPGPQRRRTKAGAARCCEGGGRGLPGTSDRLLGFRR
jgi:hypothetical protein